MMPTAVFLDTSVLAGQQYNFASTALQTFVPAATKNKLKLILPDSMEREVKRQMRDRSQEALVAFETARKKAPFLAKWSNFPKRVHPSQESWEITRIATAEWDDFLAQFEVTRVGYEHVDTMTIMAWYDQCVPPFGEGKKRKEFPDAFSIAILDSYSEKNDCSIAVVSEDQDFKLACERFPNLLYFKNLPRLTELLLSKEDNVAKLHAAIDSNSDELTVAVQNDVEVFGFRHCYREFEIRNSKDHGVSIYEINIVAIGDHECTVTFNAQLEIECELRWAEDGGPDEPPHYGSQWVSEVAEISGTAKLAFNDDNTKLIRVTYVILDQDEIEITKMPRHY